MTGAVRTAMTRIFVSGLKVQAEIGVYRHEIGRVQPLVIDVDLDVSKSRWLWRPTRWRPAWNSQSSATEFLQILIWRRSAIGS